jgi:hypothetical protein
MRKIRFVLMLLAIGLLSPVQRALAEPQMEEQKLRNAMSAGPPSVAEAATILDGVDTTKAKVLRKGTNGWTCVPDDPGSPGNNPQCLNKNGLEWWAVLMAHRAPKLTAPGIDYMLQGRQRRKQHRSFCESACHRSVVGKFAAACHVHSRTRAQRRSPMRSASLNCSTLGTFIPAGFQVRNNKVSQHPYRVILSVH